MDEHMQALEALCRICGQRCTKWPKYNNGLATNRHKERIFETFQVNVNKDVEEIHPKKICLSCASCLGKPGKSNRPIIGWTEHTFDCKACGLIRGTRGKRRLKPATVAARRRKVREEEEREEAEVELACNVLLAASAKSTKQPSRMLQRVATDVIKRVMKDDIAELPTGGPKFVLQKLTKPRIPSDKASTRTVRSRSHQIRKTISKVSSPEENEAAAIHQLAALLHGKSREELKVLLESEGLLTIRIPAGAELAMKAQMGWTWNEMRKLKRWLKAYKVQMVCEAKSRKMKGELVGDWVQADMVPFVFKEGDEHVTKLAPMVYIPNLEDHIMMTMDELEKHNLLMCEGIPEDEVWIKIGGDSGGGSTKFYYQVVNVAKTNSKFNTTAFCVYKADESVPNLHMALDQYVEQIKSLQHATWRGKKFVVFLVGDYEIERKLLGLQGAAATFPCTHCHQTRDMLDNDMEATLRDLTTLQQDFEKVESQGFTSEAKRENHSVSHRTFFDIPLSQVCPPALHLSLGLWGKIWKNLEQDLQDLGQLIAEDKINEQPCSSSISSNSSFETCITKTKKILEEVRSKEEEADDLWNKAVDLEYELITQSLIDGPAPNHQQMEEIQTLHRQSQALNKEAEELKNANKIEREKNPLTKRLDKKLQTFKVRRQAYFSNAFVGNHVDKCLKVENYTSLLEEIVIVTNELSKRDDIRDRASQLQVKYLMLIEKLSKCHKGYSTSKTLQPEDVSTLENNIKDLVGFYKSNFSNFSFTPKFHILFRHVIPIIRATGVGLGRLSEQGGEQLHHQFNILGRNLQGIKNVQGGESPELRHLKAIFEEHLISVNPTLRPRNQAEE